MLGKNKSEEKKEIEMTIDDWRKEEEEGANISTNEEIEDVRDN